MINVGLGRWLGGGVQVAMFKYFTEQGGAANKAMGRAPPADLGYGQKRAGSALRSTYGGASIGQKAGAKI